MRNIVKRVLFIMCLILASAGTGSYVHADMNQTIQVMVNGQLLNMNQPAVYKNGRVMVPMRAVTEALNATIKFQSAKKPIVIKSGSFEVSFTLGQKTAYTNGKKLALEVPPQNINNTMMVPIQLISKGMNTDVVWKDVWKTVAIESKHAASEVVTTQAEALQKAKGFIDGDNSTAKIKGQELLRYYSVNLDGYNNGVYLVDKYNGEVLYYSISDGAFQSISRRNALEVLEAKMESQSQELTIDDKAEIKIINGNKYYAFNVEIGDEKYFNSYVVSTMYVSVDGETFLMLNKDHQVVGFSDKAFSENMNAVSLRVKALEVLDKKVRSLLGNEPNLMDDGEIKTINKQNYYVIEVCFVGANNPYYYVTTAYVSADAKSIYMLTKDNKVVLFSDKLFVQYINDALEG